MKHLTPRLIFEQVYGEIAPYRKFEKDEQGQYYDGGTEEAWKLWQKQLDTTYANRATVELVKALLENVDYNKMPADLAQEVDVFLNQHEPVNVVIGPWEDRKV